MGRIISLSNNHFSVDQQAWDVVQFIEGESLHAYNALLVEFPEIKDVKWSGSHFDTEAMGVDPEWGSWLVDHLEQIDEIWWEEGEPWAFVTGP